MKILILFAHPAFQKSTVNKVLLKDINKINGVTFHDLYEHYPEFDIDISREKQLLAEHDCIIFQHPFFWYSSPALLKEWQDLVLEHGWAFGTEGMALKGKLFFNALTVGASSQAYTLEGMQKTTVQNLLAPMKQTAKLCKMIALPPFIVYGTHAINMHEIKDYQKNYRKLLNDIVQEKFDLEKMMSYDSLNDYIVEKED